MGFFSSSKKKIIEEFSKKSEEHSKEISKEINELLDDLVTEYDKDDEVVQEFTKFVDELKSKLSVEDTNKLIAFSGRFSRIKHCAQNGVEAMRELARDQRKLTRETKLEYEEYFYVK